MSYRTAYTRDFAARVADHLRIRLEGRARIFRCVEEMQPGEPFPKRLREEVKGSAVVLVVIGPRWLQEMKLRANENDWVRSELQIALHSRRP